MVQISGKYELVKSENYASHLVSLGLPEDKAKEAEQNKAIHDISHNGDKISFHIHFDEPLHVEFILNKEVDEGLPGFTVLTTSALEGDTLTLKSKYPNGKSDVKIFKFSDCGFTVTYQDENPATLDAVRVFKRL